MTTDLRQRGALPPAGLAETFNNMQGAPTNDHSYRDDTLLLFWEEAMDALRVYEARLGALGNHANKLSKRLSDMIKDGGTIIAE